MTIDDQLFELEGYRLTLSHEIIELQNKLEQVHPLHAYPTTGLSLERAEEARILMLEASELMHELNILEPRLKPLHDEYEYGS